ncbi:MAG: hypothetical protein J6A89_01725 [Clostridia bacterium]|nr:hypothetical protein [Clostridia bacterium]
MTKEIVKLLSDFIGASANTIDSFLKALYYFAFYIEKQFRDINVNWNSVYKVIYEYAIIMLVIVFIKKMIETYFLWKSGEDDVSPVHVVLGLFEAITIMLCFGYFYTCGVQIGGNIFESIKNAMMETSSFSVNDLANWCNSGIFSAIVCLILVIEFLILIWQLIRRGIELLILRLIVPFTAIGLLSSNGGAFSIVIKKFLQNICTIIVQLLLLILAMTLASKNHLIYAIAVCLVCNQTPQFLQEFIAPAKGFGVGQKVNRAIDTVHDGLGAIGTWKSLKSNKTK